MLYKDNKGVSVFRTNGLTEQEIWLLGKLHGPKLSPKQCIHGRGDLKVFEFRKQNYVKVEPDVAHHIRHANIVGWPENSELQRHIANILADKAKLVLKPN